MVIVRLILVLLLMMPVAGLCFYLWKNCVDYALNEDKSSKRAKKSRPTDRDYYRYTGDSYSRGVDPYNEYINRRGERR